MTLDRCSFILRSLMLTDLHVSFIYTFNKHSGSTKYSGAYKTDDGFSLPQFHLFSDILWIRRCAATVTKFTDKSNLRALKARSCLSAKYICSAPFARQLMILPGVDVELASGLSGCPFTHPKMKHQKADATGQEFLRAVLFFIYKNVYLWVVSLLLEKVHVSPCLQRLKNDFHLQ